MPDAQPRSSGAGARQRGRPAGDAGAGASPLQLEINQREDWRWSSARAHLALAADNLTDLAAAAERVEDWRAFLDAGLGDEACEAIRAAERLRRLLP
jgi:hypothetical protein